MDYTIQIQGALRGGMLYLEENMANYRWMVEGSWTSRFVSRKNFSVDFARKIVAMLQQLDKDTDRLYHETIAHTSRRHEFVLLEGSGNYAAMRKAPYRQMYRQLSLRRKLSLAAREFTPWLYKLLRK